MIRKVTFTHAQQQQLLHWLDEAAMLGLEAEYERCLAVIEFRLKYEADEWGELKGHYLFARLVVRSGRFELLEVDYAVHEDDPMVFVRSIACRFPTIPGA